MVILYFLLFVRRGFASEGHFNRLFLVLSTVRSGDHESDCVKDCGPYKFSPCAVGADVMNIVYLHVAKSPFLLKTHWFQYSIREGNLKVKIDNIICKWQVYIVVNGIVKCKLKK